LGKSGREDLDGGTGTEEGTPKPSENEGRPIVFVCFF
jgi:hypothetical protein